MDLKIFNVTFNDGGWHSGGLPKITVVATDNKNAIEVTKTINNGLYNKLYKDWESWATEFKIDGYEINIKKI